MISWPISPIDSTACFSMSGLPIQLAPDLSCRFEQISITNLNWFVIYESSMDVGHFGPTFTSSVYAVCPLGSGLGMGMMKMMDPLRRKCVIKKDYCLMSSSNL